MALFTVTQYLQPLPPFDFSQSLAFLGMFTPTKNDQTLTGQLLTRAFMIDRQVVACQVTFMGTIDEPKLCCTLLSEQSITNSVQQAAFEWVALYLSLDDDLRPFYAIAESDPCFTPILRQLYGLHQVRFPTPFENACWAILTQRTPMPAAQMMKQSLIERFGGSMVIGNHRYDAFPSADSMASASETELEALLNNHRKAEYICAASRAFSQFDEPSLRTGDYDTVEKSLLAIKGIGPWSASFVMLRGLGRMERIPLGEGRLNEVFARVYGPLAKIEAVAAQYGQYQGYWAHYLRASA
jgi:DNA-3-methyladenine glycosylase II